MFDIVITHAELYRCRPQGKSTDDLPPKEEESRMGTTETQDLEEKSAEEEQQTDDDTNDAKTHPVGEKLRCKSILICVLLQ